ncbi:MAG: L-2-amino-thiazoline-4-carboxylic acid hydrolase [Lachnospiraceae bacterium]|nr:L-2-amino-thiazoline-4-carboxylic acid hydrolase [Lachnospiraceae bacterium]
MKYPLNYNIYTKEFRVMIEEHFTKQEAEAIWKDANRQFVKMKKEHPDAYTSAVKVSYPFAGIYMALNKYMPKEEALAMMMEYAPRIGEKIRKIYWRFTSIPGVSTLIWKNFDKIMKSAGSEKEGYKSKLYGVKGDKAALDILSCPVVNALAEIGMPEVAPVMCAIDQVYSKGYRGIKFRRTKSVAEGDDCCDYRYKRVTAVKG